MTVQCLYQNDPKDAAAVLGQRNACRRAANKLGWLIQQERICDASEGTPLLLRPDVQELLRDVEQGRFQVLVVASAEVLQCPEGEWESLLAVLQKGRVRTFAAQRGCWLEPGGRRWPGRIGRDCTNRLVLLRYLRKTAKNKCIYFNMCRALEKVKRPGTFLLGGTYHAKTTSSRLAVRPHGGRQARCPGRTVELSIQRSGTPRVHGRERRGRAPLRRRP